MVDTLSVNYMDEIFYAYPEYKDYFSDFTYYRNTLGVYATTHGAITYLYSGVPYFNHKPFNDHLLEAYNKSPFLRRFSENSPKKPRDFPFSESVTIPSCPGKWEYQDFTKIVRSPSLAPKKENPLSWMIRVIFLDSRTKNRRVSLGNCFHRMLQGSLWIPWFSRMINAL